MRIIISDADTMVSSARRVQGVVVAKGLPHIAGHRKLARSLSSSSKTFA
jgi:hypothetical protein